MLEPLPTALTDGDLVAAFPRRLSDEVRAVLAVMPGARLAPASPFSVYVDDEALAIPCRIYPDEPPVDEVRTLTARQRVILHCLYSRHHDGRVRQRHLKQVVGVDLPWVVPFVVQLVGEYVLEILEEIEDGLSGAGDAQSVRWALYGDFIIRNPEFFALTERRVASYWTCYHRWRFPVFGTYPGGRLLELLRAAASDRAGRRWPRHAPAGFKR
ncbi:hypothetical protein [Streptomyces sp. NPDC046909]|uniref:hypothetical protein n=1 Tax=Streptomyces sp. NPDC046909 TaxID=3155617 RepID=UPI0033D43DED